MASNPHRFIFDNVDILGTSGNAILIQRLLLNRIKR